MELFAHYMSNYEIYHVINRFQIPTFSVYTESGSFFFILLYTIMLSLYSPKIHFTCEIFIYINVL